MVKTDFKYCPQCKTEYKHKIKICADCNVTLVDEKSQDVSLEKIEWVEIGQFPGKIFGEMSGEILRNNNIPFFLKSDFFSSAFNITLVNVPGAVVKLYVPENDKENAENLVRNMTL